MEPESDYFEWAAQGLAGGFAGPAVCATEDGVPTTEAEDEMYEQDEMPCIPIRRLYADPETRAAVEAAGWSVSSCPTPFIPSAEAAAWAAVGIAEEWAGPVMCDVHDGVPISHEEDAMSAESGAPCLHVLRLYADALTKASVEANHTPSNWRQLWS